jgi:predicted MPP superfamily phosphohydrolase
MTSFFTTITIFLTLINGSLLLLMIGLLQRRRPWPHGIAWAGAAWFVLMMAIYALQAFSPVTWQPFLRHWFYFPIAVEMAWNLVLLYLLVFLGAFVALALRLFRPARKDAPALPPDALSRRRFIYLLGCGAVPAVAVGMGVHGTLTRHDLRVREFRLPIPGLPPELEGFTIAHLSDLHSGIFCGPSRLKIITDATNDLKPDLIAITGDIINHDLIEFPDALTAMQRMHSRYGSYLCEGNHDVFPGPGVVAALCAKNHLPMLRNQGVTIPVEGRRLVLAGVPWMGRHYHGVPAEVSTLFPARQEGDVRILLAHHPDFLDLAASADLVLTGHTHGGQIMLGPVGLGPLFFKYWSGLYTRGHTTMIVSNGCGDWFPCRIGAPAEIGLLRLTAKA